MTPDLPNSGKPSFTAEVLSIGLCTPLGAGLRVNQIEVAAEATRFEETEVTGAEDAPIRASRLTWINPRRKRTERMAALARRALRECLQPLTSGPRRRLPLFLGLPAAKSGGLVNAETLVDRLRQAAGDGIELDTGPDRIFPHGRAAFFSALDAACAFLETAGSLALVGSVDSLCDVTSLTYLGMVNRALGPANPDGIIPGEGAGFALLGRSGALTESPVHGFRVLARAISREERHFQQSLPNLAEGLTRVFRSLRTHPAIEGKPTYHLLSCQTGETFWGKEFAMAYLRNAPLMPEPMSGNFVAENFGDVGAGSGAVMLGVAHGFSRPEEKTGDSRRIVIYGCSDEGPVGGCVVEGQ